MILIIPGMTDNFVKMLQAGELGQTNTVILDGPSPSDTSMSGIAVGASVDDPSGEFSMPVAAIQGDSGQRYALRCLAWARSGETVWQRTRNRCADIVRLAEATLATDRTIGGSVSSAFIAGGTFDQQMGESGMLVLCEFRIEAVRF